MAKAVKMSDIAKKLNVSTVTVSKALSDQKGVSREVRDKIKSMAEEMGYQRPAARQEEKTRSYNIGAIVAEGYMDRHESFYWELYQDINLTASKKNSFVMLEVLSSTDEKALIPPKLLRENKIDGLIILGGLRTDYLKMISEHYSTPVIYMDFYDPESKEDSIISNSFYGTYAITNYLFEMGHTNIAFVGTFLATKSITDRYLGYVKSLAEHGRPIRSDWLINDRDKDRHSYLTFQLPEEMPTAFVCNCDMTANHLIETLNKKGYRVPEDVSVVGFDNYLHPELRATPVTTYAVNMTEMAESGLKLLIKKIQGQETSGGMHLVEGRFIERDTVRAI